MMVAGKTLSVAEATFPASTVVMVGATVACRTSLWAAFADSNAMHYAAVTAAVRVTVAELHCVVDACFASVELHRVAATDAVHAAADSTQSMFAAET